MIAGGVAAGFAGLVVGGTTYDGNELSDGFQRAGIFATLAIPLGVHLGNGRRGNFLLAQLAAVGMAAVGEASGAQLLTPVVGLETSVAIKAATTH